MHARFPTMKRAQKVVAATVICGALALGTAGVASAATPTGAGSAPATATHVTCARAPKALTRMAKVEHAISRRLPKLQAAETKAKAAGHTKVASRIERRIHRLQKVNTKARSLAKKINARCPQGTSGTGSGSAS